MTELALCMNTAVYISILPIPRIPPLSCSHHLIKTAQYRAKLPRISTLEKKHHDQTELDLLQLIYFRIDWKLGASIMTVDTFPIDDQPKHGSWMPGIIP